MQKKTRQNSGKQRATPENAATNQISNHIQTTNSNTAYIAHANQPQIHSESTIKIMDHEIKAGNPIYIKAILQQYNIRSHCGFRSQRSECLDYSV